MKVTLHARITHLLLAAGFCMVILSGSVSARMLGVAWERGVVTKAPWTETDGSRYIEVDGFTYTFVSPEVALERHERTSSDSWNVARLRLSEIWVGQEVLIRIAAHHIYHLIIEVGG